jgi:hypothetical protein
MNKNIKKIEAARLLETKLAAQLKADLQAEKEAQEAIAEEIRLNREDPDRLRLNREADERAFCADEANAWDAEFIRDDFSPRRPVPQVDPGSSGYGHYPI